MNKRKCDLPMVATSNGWTPIRLFDFDSDYAWQSDFLVWMADRHGREWFETARIASGCIVSDARNICDRNGAPAEHRNGLHPVAFKLVEGPDRNALHRLCQRYAAHMPDAERHPGQPRLRFAIARETSH